MANATDASAIADDRATPNDDDDDATSSMRALRVGDDGEDEDAPRRARTILCPVTERDDDANAVKWARDNLVDAKRGDCVHLLHILPRRTEAVAGYAYPMMGAPTRRGGRVCASRLARALSSRRRRRRRETTDGSVRERERAQRATSSKTPSASASDWIASGRNTGSTQSLDECCARARRRTSSI
jgi:hypothetical protein